MCKGKIKRGFCLQPKVDPYNPPERGGQPVCPDCLKEWDQCFTKTQERQLCLFSPASPRGLSGL